MKKDTTPRAEHEVVQSYYRILSDLKETRKEGDPQITGETVATLAAAAVISEQMEHHGEAIKGELAGISELLSKD